MDLKLLFLIVFCLTFLWKTLLHYLNARSIHNPTPENVKDVYDSATYDKWRRYHSEKNRFALIAGTFSFAVSLLLYIFNAYAAFASLFGTGDFVQMLSVVILSDIAGFLSIPFEWYETMSIEGRYGFNRTTPATFIKDQVIGFVLTNALMIGLGALYIALMQLGNWALLLLAGVLIVFMLFIGFIAPLLTRLFNKFTPLEDGELKEKLTALLQKNGYHVKGIRVMDASKRSTKSNAYFTGFGKTKEIVLYDTLISSMSPDEICAVFAHEMGHGLHKDTLKMQLTSGLSMAVLGVMLFITARYADISAAFGFAGVNYGLCMLLVMEVEFAFLSPLFGLFSNYLSRKAEYRADAQAVKEGYGKDLTQALKKLTVENLGDLSPDPLLVKLEYSHPPLSERIRAIEKESK